MALKLNILDLVTDDKCYDFLRSVRWYEGLICPHCTDSAVVKNGRCSHNKQLQKYHCQQCQHSFNDVTDTVFQDSNKPLKVWILALYLLGLNLSNRQIAKELDLTEKTAQQMTTKLREGIVKKSLIYTLSEQLRLTKFT
jgi:transposase-like protein